MSLLKALGQFALKAGKVALGAFLGAVHQDVQLPVGSDADVFLGIIQQVVQAELSGTAIGLTGDQKRKVAAIVVEQIILKSPLALGKKLKDPAKFRADVEALTGDVADILNDFEDGSIDTKDLT